MRKRFAASISLAVIIAMLACGCGGTVQDTQDETPPGPEVPEKYESIYMELETKLAELNAYLDATWDGEERGTVFSVELVTANANRGEALLQPGTLYAIQLTLEDLKDMGLTGITLSINYPLLNPDFPRSQEYLGFYRNVAAQAKALGFTLIVETTTIFPNPEISGLGVDYTGLTLDEYMQEKHAMAETVLRELEPDYLTVENEPTTQKANTGLDFSVADQTAIVNHILSGLERSGTKIGAGAGTWDDAAYFESLAANTSLDYLDMHIYPIQDDLVIDRAERVSTLARSTGKGLAVSETWLYKTAASELGPGHDIAMAADVFSRDAYSFWIPLDQDFLEVMVKLSHHLQLEFVSPFWMQYLFAYIEFDPAIDERGYAWINELSGSRAWINIQTNSLSPTGETYRDLVAK